MSDCGESYEQGCNEWLESDSEEFLEFGWAFVPDREQQINIVASLVPRTESVLVIDLCAGEGLLSEEILRRCPRARVIAYDGSKKMLTTAAARLKEFGQRFQTRCFNLAERSWRGEFPIANCVVSSLAIHHLGGEQKAELFRDLARRLAPGGRMIIADIIEPESAAARAAAAAAWDECVKANSLRRFGDLRAWEAFRSLRWNYFTDLDPDPVDKPSPVFAQLRWLEEAGFEAIDVHWAKAGHAIFSGSRPASAED
jgi:tRNA (cmo5U34)-methyltransferase